MAKIKFELEDGTQLQKLPKAQSEELMDHILNKIRAQMKTEEKDWNVSDKDGITTEKNREYFLIWKDGAENRFYSRDLLSGDLVLDLNGVTYAWTSIDNNAIDTLIGEWPDILYDSTVTEVLYEQFTRKKYNSSCYRNFSKRIVDNRKSDDECEEDEIVEDGIEDEEDSDVKYHVLGSGRRLTILSEEEKKSQLKDIIGLIEDMKDLHFTYEEEVETRLEDHLREIKGNTDRPVGVGLYSLMEAKLENILITDYDSQTYYRVIFKDGTEDTFSDFDILKDRVNSSTIRNLNNVVYAAMTCSYGTTDSEIGSWTDNELYHVNEIHEYLDILNMMFKV